MRGGSADAADTLLRHWVRGGQRDPDAKAPPDPDAKALGLTEATVHYHRRTRDTTTRSPTTRFVTHSPRSGRHLAHA